jgi:MFS family permease
MRSEPARAMSSAVITTVVVSIPVFLVGGLAVQIGLSARDVGVAMSVYFAASALAAMPAGALVERFGPVRTARCGIGLSFVSLMAIGAAASSLRAVVLLLVVGALGNAMGQLASNAALARQIPAGRLGLSFGMKQAAIPVCTLLAGIAVPAVAVTAGWRWAFIIAAGACLPAVLLPAPGAAGTEPAPAGRPGRPSSGLLLVGVAAALGAAGANALGAFVALSSAEQGTSPAMTGLLLAGGSVVCVAARVIAGRRADLRPDNQIGVIAALLTCGSLGLLLLAVPGPAPLTGGIMLGFGLGWAWPGLLNFAIVRLHPRSPAAASSVTLTGAQAGACLGPLGLGALAHSAGYPTMWLTAGGLLLAAAGLMLAGRRLIFGAARAGTSVPGRRDRGSPETTTASTMDPRP